MKIKQNKKTLEKYHSVGRVAKYYFKIIERATQLIAMANIYT